MLARLLMALVLLTGVTAFAPAPLPKREKRANDSLAVANLVGTYRTTRLLSVGSQTPQDLVSNGVAHVTITPTQWTFLGSKTANPTVYELTIDHNKKPAEINFYNKGQMGGTPYGTGIIRREGNSLRIIYTWGTRAPINFENPPSGYWDLTIQRE